FGEEASLAGIAGAGVLGIGVIEALQVPAAIGGEGGDGVAALGYPLPQVFWRADVAGVAAGHADDRDRLVSAVLEALNLLMCLAKIDRDLLQVPTKLCLIPHQSTPFRCCVAPARRPTHDSRIPHRSARTSRRATSRRGPQPIRRPQSNPPTPSQTGSPVANEGGCSPAHEFHRLARAMRESFRA